MPPASGTGADTRPNIVFIVTDDQTIDSIAAGTPAMPWLDAQVTSPTHHWLRFTNAFFNFSLCCPSRATFLTGQYAFHHHVEGNSMGGKLDESSTVATWLHDAGYHTGLIGKYLNHYPFQRGDYIPPGWDRWFAKEGDNSEYYGFTVNDQGTAISYDGTGVYSTDLYGQKARAFVDAAPAGVPFFLYLAFSAPHAPYQPAPGDLGTLDGQTTVHNPDLNEADVSDKPAWVQGRPLVNLSHEDRNRQLEYETLLEVDRQVHALVDDLSARGLLNNTIIVFTSDNGYAFGEHRWDGKRCEYDECLREAFLVRAPGATAGTIDALVSNVHVAPTFAALAQTTPSIPVDGVSLVPLFDGSVPGDWRTGVLFEYQFDSSTPIPTYVGIRTADAKYVELATGEKELYRLGTDPWELTNVAVAHPSSGSLQDQLAHRLQDLLGADVSVTLSGVPGSAVPGDQVTYTAKVSDLGEGAALDTTLTDPLPSSATFVSATTTQGSCSGAATVSCALGRVPAKAPVTVTIVATMGGTSSAVTNVVSAATSTRDTDASNDTASVTTTVKQPTPADLSLTNTDAPDPVASGGSLTYTLAVHDAGPGTARDVVISDPIPAGTELVSVSPATRCTGTTTITCTYPSVKPDSNVGAKITVTVTAPNGSTILDTAKVSSTSPDPTTDDLIARATTSVSAPPPPSADVSVALTDGPDPVVVNHDLTYTIRAANAGPDDATGVVVALPIPAGSTFVSVTPALCSGTSTVTCPIGLFPHGKTVRVTVVVRPTQLGQLDAMASVSSTSHDPNAANDTSSTTTTVAPPPSPLRFEVLSRHG